MTSGGTTLRGFVPKARTAIALHVPQYTVWGAGTDIGKSLVSAGICRTQTLKVRCMCCDDISARICIAAARYGNKVCRNV